MSVRVYRQVVTTLRTQELASDRKIDSEPVLRTLTIDRVELTPETGGETATHYLLSETHRIASASWTFWAEEYANELEASANFDAALDQDAQYLAALASETTAGARRDY